MVLQSSFFHTSSEHCNIFILPKTDFAFHPASPAPNLFQPGMWHSPCRPNIPRCPRRSRHVCGALLDVFFDIDLDGITRTCRTDCSGTRLQNSVFRGTDESRGMPSSNTPHGSGHAQICMQCRDANSKRKSDIDWQIDRGCVHLPEILLKCLVEWWLWNGKGGR